MSGYARFHRSLIGHPAFRNDAEAMAFAYMVLRASWKQARVRYKGKPIGLNRGQLALSVRDLAEAMDRGKGWVERLLTRLKSETMIETRADTGVLVITICNYEKYQHSNDERGTRSETARETDAGQTRDTEQVREEVKKEGEANASPRATRVIVATRLPDDWDPGTLRPETASGGIVAARGEDWERRALESFRNHWRSANGPNARKRDWQAAWANWVIEQDNRDGRRGGTAQRMAGNGGSASGHGRTIDAAQRVLARRGAHVAEPQH